MYLLIALLGARKNGTLEPFFVAIGRTVFILRLETIFKAKKNATLGLRFDQNKVSIAGVATFKEGTYSFVDKVRILQKYKQFGDPLTTLCPLSQQTQLYSTPTN